MDAQIAFEMTSQESNERFIVDLPNISPTELRCIKCTYKLRLNLIEFMEYVKRMGLDKMIRVVSNSRGEIHLSDCVWCNDAIQEGPDTCHCYGALSKPADYFRNKYGIVSVEEEENLVNQLEEIRRMKINMLPIIDYTSFSL